MKINLVYALFVIVLICTRYCEFVKQDRCLDQGGRWLKEKRQCQFKSNTKKHVKVIKSQRGSQKGRKHESN